MHIPNKLYHATRMGNALSIMVRGLEPRGIEHLIYFADTFGGACYFAYMHGIPIDQIVVVEVDTTNLAKELFDYGADHSPTFFKDIEVYTYPSVITEEHISEYLQIDIDLLDKNLFR